MKRNDKAVPKPVVCGSNQVGILAAIRGDNLSGIHLGQRLAHSRQQTIHF